MNEQLTHITLVEKDFYKLLPGEVKNPCLKTMGLLGRHDEGNAGITVQPSLLCDCGAHFFVENNQIRWC